MRLRSLTASLALAALILASLAIPASAQCSKKSKPLVVKTYPVADLVVPINMDLCSDKPFDRSTTEDQLMQFICAAVAPESWSDRGGRATLQFYPTGIALVATQTEEIHERIQNLLTALRRSQLQVAVELRIVKVRDAVLEQTDLELNTDQGKPTLLSETQLYQFMEATQGDRDATVTQAPKITLFDGQRGGIDVTEQEAVVTQLVFTEKHGKFDLDCQEQKVTTGLEAKMRPVVSANRTGVTLSLDLSLREPADNCPWDLVSTTERVGRCKKQEARVHRLVRQAAVNVQNLQTVLRIPDGQTAVLFVGKEPVKGGTCSVLVLVTPRVIVTEEVEQAPIPRR